METLHDLNRRGDGGDDALDLPDLVRILAGDDDLLWLHAGARDAA